MIKHFERETHELTAEEKQLVEPLREVLIKCMGKSKCITSKQIMKLLNIKSDARVRKLINHIRTHGLVNGLIATSEGYYVSYNIHELDEYIESLAARESAIRMVRLSMQESRDRIAMYVN